MPLSDSGVNALLADRDKPTIPKSENTVNYLRENAVTQTGKRTMNEPSKNYITSEDILNNE